MRAGLLSSTDRRWRSAARLVTRRRLAWTAAVAGLLGIAATFVPLRAGVAGFAAWARGAGGAGLLAFFAAHVLCALLLVPSWPLRVAAGFVYGASWGFGLALSASLAGATLAFVASRVFLREPIARRIARDPRLVALDDAIAANGLWTVFLLRLSPVLPNELVNYGLGATRIGLRDYLVASVVGMLPLTASYAWLGSLLTAAGDLGGRRPAATGLIGQLIWWSGLATTIALAAGSAYLARGALERTLAATGDRGLDVAPDDRADVLLGGG